MAGTESTRNDQAQDVQDGKQARRHEEAADSKRDQPSVLPKRSTRRFALPNPLAGGNVG